jgi:hypothetical protein
MKVMNDIQLTCSLWICQKLDLADLDHNFQKPSCMSQLERDLDCSNHQDFVWKTEAGIEIE